ncbi:hypothetical protein BC940DRAFT_304297 [Gongronella butleri]|nr:hypothetical protein BC940DRAFT_304297 [Gongronella butleri]
MSADSPLHRERICKKLVEDQAIIDVIAKNMLNVYEGTYSFSKILDEQNTIVVTYVPKLPFDNALPPIILRLQSQLDQVEMTTAINHSLDVYQQYHQLPAVLFILPNKLSNPFLDPFDPIQDKPYLFCLPGAAWCCKCFLLSNNVENTSTYQEDELYKLSRLLLEGLDSS